MTINVYVPANPEHTAIDPGSGIVGTLDDSYLPRLKDNPVALRIDYEGNRFGAVNIVTWADRCYHAAGRHLDHYPTIARAWVDPESMILVGQLDMQTGVVTRRTTSARDLRPSSGDLIHDWLNVSWEQLEIELLTTNHHHEEKRHDHSLG